MLRDFSFFAPTRKPIENALTLEFDFNKDPPVGELSKDTCNATKTQSTDVKKSNNRTSLCEEKLIPGNMVPDIVELLVALGLIQQQVSVDDMNLMTIYYNRLSRN